MFNKSLYDKSLYDRSVSSDDINGILMSRSIMDLKLVVITPLAFNPMTSQSPFGMYMTMIQTVNVELTGEGHIEDTEVILLQNIKTNMSGSGDLKLNINAKTDIKGILNGYGTLKDLKPDIHQHIYGRLTGSGTVSSKLNFNQLIDVSLQGEGQLQNKEVNLKLNIAPEISGSGDLVMSRFGSLGEDIFELIGIDLKPGETVTIDTDLLDVIFGHRHDVTSVTADSVFFELNPGENQITISTDVEGSLDTTIIWNNRWL